MVIAILKPLVLDKILFPPCFWRTMPNICCEYETYHLKTLKKRVAKKSDVQFFSPSQLTTCQIKVSIFIALWTLVQRSLLTQDSTLGLQVIRRRITIYQKKSSCSAQRNLCKTKQNLPSIVLPVTSKYLCSNFELMKEHIKN